MRCEEIMNPVEVIKTRESIHGAARKMRSLNIGFLPITDDTEAVVGTITDRDLVIRALADALPSQTHVDQIMTPAVLSCHPADDISRAEDLMRINQKVRILCIDDNGRAAGVISLADIAQYEDAAKVGDIVADVTEREVRG